MRQPSQIFWLSTTTNRGASVWLHLPNKKQCRFELLLETIGNWNAWRARAWRIAYSVVLAFFYKYDLVWSCARWPLVLCNLFHVHWKTNKSNDCKNLVTYKIAILCRNSSLAERASAQIGKSFRWNGKSKERIGDRLTVNFVEQYARTQALMGKRSNEINTKLMTYVVCEMILWCFAPITTCCICRRVFLDFVDD